MMYNSQLTVFICVADCGSFNKAAEKLYISPPAAMKQINSLEKQLNIKLFNRSNHGISLTAAGKSIYKDAKYLIDYSNQAVKNAHNLMIDEEYTFCVATSLLNPCKPFMDLWYQINDNFPEYKIHVVPFADDNEGVLSVIGTLGKEYDFLVGAFDSPQWLSRCSYYKLGTYKRSYGVPVTHRLAKRDVLKLEDLYGETIMMPKRGTSCFNDTQRDEIEKNHPRIEIMDAPSFYDMEVFNQCVQAGSILYSAECWCGIHPSLVSVPMENGNNIDQVLMFSADPPEDVMQIVEAIKAL